MMSPIIRHVIKVWPGTIVLDVIRSVEAVQFWWNMGFIPADNGVKEFLAPKIVNLQLHDLTQLKDDSYVFIHEKR